MSRSPFATAVCVCRTSPQSCRWQRWPQWRHHRITRERYALKVLADDFFEEDPFWGGSQLVFRESFVESLITRPLAGHADADVALALTNLVRDSLEAFATGGLGIGHIPESGAGMSTALRSLKAILRRLDIPQEIDWRDYSTFKSHWVRLGATGQGSWAARRQILALVFDPITARLQERLKSDMPDSGTVHQEQDAPTYAAAAVVPSPSKKAQRELSTQPSTKELKLENQEIFIVHGHDTSVRHEVELHLIKVTGLQPIVLNNMVSRGKTLIEKFEHYANPSAYAVVLLTPDDLGKAKSEPEARAHEGAPDSSLQARARQNVVFEMGYFYGKLGRDKVSTISSGVEEPGDIRGVVYIPFDHEWKTKLNRELHDAGFKIDALA